MIASPDWPELNYHAWKDTCSTLHLWTQIVGKIRLAQTPWLNHSWHVPLYVTAKGLTSSPIPHGSRYFEMQFDFNARVLDIGVSDGTGRQLALVPQSVAEFYGAVMTALADLGVPVVISDYPCEIPGAIAFGKNRAQFAFDAEAARRFGCALRQADRVLKQFRSAFIGKCSPVHFFWGSFDLAVTRFSGRKAPPNNLRLPGMSVEIMREAAARCADWDRAALECSPGRPKVSRSIAGEGW